MYKNNILEWNERKFSIYLHEVHFRMIFFWNLATNFRMKICFLNSGNIVLFHFSSIFRVHRNQLLMNFVWTRLNLLDLIDVVYTHSWWNYWWTHLSYFNICLYCVLRIHLECKYIYKAMQVNADSSTHMCPYDMVYCILMHAFPYRVHLLVVRGISYARLTLTIEICAVMHII